MKNEEKINFKKEKIPFTQVANEVLYDKNLSAKAKGLYAYLYAKPEGWDFAIDRIAEEFKDGRRSINGGLQELEQNGYLIRKREATGRVMYILKSQMSKIDMREVEPHVQNSKVLKQQSAKTDTVSNKEVKEIKSIKNKEENLPKVVQIKGKEISTNFLSREMWQEWTDYRKEIKKTLTPTSEKRQLEFLSEHKNDACEIIEQSIRNQWTGLFPLKNTKNYRNKSVEFIDGTK